LPERERFERKAVTPDRGLGIRAAGEVCPEFWLQVAFCGEDDLLQRLEVAFLDRIGDCRLRFGFRLRFFHLRDARGLRHRAVRLGVRRVRQHGAAGCAECGQIAEERAAACDLALLLLARPAVFQGFSRLKSA
jgi:hypothetical protein